MDTAGSCKIRSFHAIGKTIARQINTFFLYWMLEPKPEKLFKSSKTININQLIKQMATRETNQSMRQLPLLVD